VQLLVRLMSMLYGAALNDVSEMEDTSLQFIDFTDLQESSLVFLEGAHIKSEIILQWIQRAICEAAGSDVIKVAPPILSRVYNQLGNGIVMLNNAQKLNEFPVPFPVAQMILLMLVLHWFLTAQLCAVCSESPWWAFIQAFVVVLMYWSLHYIGEELEQPFGDDANDLPISEMQADMNASLLDLLSPEARNAPSFGYSSEKHGEGMPPETRTLSLDSHLGEVSRQATAELQQQPRVSVMPRGFSWLGRASRPRSTSPPAQPQPVDVHFADVGTGSYELFERPCDHDRRVSLSPSPSPSNTPSDSPSPSLCSRSRSPTPSALAGQAPAADSLMRSSAVAAPQELSPGSKHQPRKMGQRCDRQEDDDMMSQSAPTESSASKASDRQAMSDRRAPVGRSASRAPDRRGTLDRRQSPRRPVGTCCPAQLIGSRLLRPQPCMGW